MRFTNHSPVPFRGWVRTTTDRPGLEPQKSYRAESGETVVTGRKLGSGVGHYVDVLVDIQPGKTIEITGALSPIDFAAPPPPPDFFGGQPVAGEEMTLLEMAVNGAAFESHYRILRGSFVVDLWLRWYPLEPWVYGSLLVNHSNQASPAMTATWNAPEIRFGDGIMIPLGKGPNEAPIPAGTVFGDGQALPSLVTWLWPNKMRAGDMHNAMVACGRQIGAVGMQQLWPDGNPVTWTEAEASAWMREHHPKALRSLSNWSPIEIGVSRSSIDTGGQEDQVFVGGESLACPGAEQVRLFAALRQAARPCHHREPDGSIVDPQNHPGLVYWDSRPFRILSSTMLGKPREIMLSETSGWYGDDIQHCLHNSQAVAYLLTGEPLAQHLLEHAAYVYLGQRLEIPGASHSVPHSARDIGWECILVVHLLRCLEDARLRTRIRERFLARWTKVIRPWLGERNEWDVRKDDPRLGSGDWWMAWQQAVGAYGLDLVARYLDIPEAKIVALRAASRVVDAAWVHDGSRWVESENLALDGRRHRSGMFSRRWMAMAVRVVLQYQPSDPRAAGIWEQMVADVPIGDRSWLPPFVPF